MLLNNLQWSRHIEQFESSDFTQREYARAHNLNIHTFRGQLYRARKQLEPEHDLRLVPVRLQVQDQPSRSPSLRFELGDFKLCFDPLPDPRYLARLMQALIDQES